MMKQRRSDVEYQVSNGDFDEEYADYIMKNCGGDRVICNGDTLLCAMEDAYLFDEFVSFLMTAETEDV